MYFVPLTPPSYLLLLLGDANLNTAVHQCFSVEQMFPILIKNNATFIGGCKTNFLLKSREQIFSKIFSEILSLTFDIMKKSCPENLSYVAEFI